MTAPTPKRIAASILSTDMEIIVGYWQERYPDLANHSEAINEQMDKILKPFERRLRKIAKDIRCYELAKSDLPISCSFNE